MNTIRAINDDMAIAGQIDWEQLKHLAVEGFQSVLNLRSPDESDFWVDEQEKVEFLNLNYANFPLRLGEIDLETSARLLQYLNHLPKPVLVHCDSAMRSAAIALMWVATRQGISLEKTLEQARQFGLLDCPDLSQIRFNSHA